MTNDPVLSTKYNGYTINLEYADYYDNPRDWDGNLSTMLCFHARYNLGDKSAYTSTMFSGWEDVKRQIKADGGVCIKQLTLYDHSGLTIYMTEEPHLVQYPQWDSMPVGFIFTTREKLKEWYGWKRLTNKRMKQVYKQIKNELELYDYYLRGEVYELVIRDKDDELVESVTTFYGYDNAIKYVDDAKPLIDMYNVFAQEKQDA
jgi:hypothetical protein